MKRWLAAALFAALVAVFFNQILLGRAFLGEDFLEEELPHRAFAARALAAGDFPQWDPYTFGGMPFFADPHVGLLYPTHLAVALLAPRGVLPVRPAEIAIVLHFWLAAFGMFLVAARLFGLGWWGAALAGSAYGFSGIMVVHACHPGMLFQVAWFPILFLMFVRGFGSWPWALAAGIALGVSFLAGHAQTTLYTLLALLVAGIVLAANSSRGGATPSRLAAGTIRMLASALIAAGLFAVQLLPALEMLHLSERASVASSVAAEYALTWRQVGKFLAPTYLGHAEATSPRIIVLLAAMGLWFRGRASGPDRLAGLRGYLIALAAFAFLFALGDRFVVWRALAHAPGFRLFRAPVRVMYLWNFSLAILAGNAFDRLQSGEIRLARPARWFVIVAAALTLLAPPVLAAKALVRGDDVARALTDHVAILVLVMGVVVAGGLAIAASGRMRSGARGSIVLSVLTIDLFLLGYRYNNGTTTPRAFFGRAPAEVARLVQAGGDELFRVKMAAGGRRLLERNQGPVDRLFLLEGYNPIALARRLPSTPWSDDAALDLMNVKYAVDTSAVESARPDAAASRDVGLALRERSGYLPRAALFYSARVLDDIAAAGGPLPPFDPRREILLEEPPGIPLPAGGASGLSRARITRYEPDEIRVEVETAENAILFLSEVWYPAWVAEVDGARRAVLRADGCLRAVPVESGRHTVLFRYESETFRRGLAITMGTAGATLGALAVVGALAARRRRRAPGD